MDLLNQNQNQKTELPKGKKIILLLLIISIITCIAIIAIMVYLGTNQEPDSTIIINGKSMESPTNLLLTDEKENQYISLKQLAQLLNFEYYNNEYNSYGLDTTKCHIKNQNLISGFELGTKEVYKYEEGTNLDYQYYTLLYPILAYNNELYISLFDLNIALNVYCSVSANNEIRIDTLQNLVATYQAKGYTVTTEPNNQKALAYGWLIVSKDNVWSVLNINDNLREIVDYKYLSIYFDEQNLNYIVSNTNNQYGIIDSKGLIECSLKYDDMEIINYENMLYKVKYNEKYGIMKSNGSMLTSISYDSIGFEAKDKKLYTLIIPALDEKSANTIVVKQNGFYGLITLENGETYLPCDHVEKLYSINELGKIEYKIEAEGITMDLKEYLQLRGII